MSSHKHKRKSKSALRLGIILLSVVLLLTAALLFIREWEADYGKFNDETTVISQEVSYNGQQYTKKDNLETILLLGLDKFENEETGYNNDKQADFIMLLVIDHSSEKCEAIYINRDTMAEINVLGVAGDKIGVVEKQLALSHTYGNGREISCRNVANAVSNLMLGMEIDHYVSVTMDAVSVYNDFVGGVSLEILDDFTFADSSMVQGQTVTLNAQQALTYVRSRYGLDDPSNVGRMKRQKQYLEALYEKSKELISEDETFVQRAALKVTNYIVSDCSINKLEGLINNISAYELGLVRELEGEIVQGEEFIEFYPGEDSIRKTVLDCFYEKS